MEASVRNPNIFLADTAVEHAYVGDVPFNYHVEFVVQEQRWMTTAT
jgi:hypothetical protein